MSEISSTSELTTKEIVEQAISDYHESILPYLNGMVPTIANKFDKANLYSTDEQIVGRWIDGKPLYQKTFDYGSNLSILNNSWTSTGISVSGNNIERIIMSYGSSPGTSGNNVMAWFFTHCESSEVMALACRYNGDVGVQYITLQYTKTTDEAIAIGSDTDYSLEEKIVGTWIDDKPLYKKTIVTSIPTSTSWTDDWIDLSSINIDYLVSLDGIVLANGVITSLTNTWNGNRNNWAFNITSGKIEAEFLNYNGADTYVTLQYTKTTD